MYLSDIKIIKEYRCLPILDIKLKNITLLVGDQGCGKSSLLKLLHENNSEYINIKIAEKYKNKSINSYFFDTEKQNPRVAPDHNYYDIHGRSIGIGIGTKVFSMFQSHGEVLREFTVETIPKADNCVILLDEPESSLSIKNQYKLAQNIISATKNNCQLIIATHCLPLIESIDTVYDLEKKEWKKSSLFINEQKNIN